jgi:pimeloyl-ACP methyl ester carboxylesterase
LLGYMAERREHERRWVGALIDADLPKRFIWGPEDPVSGAHVVHELQARLPGARIEVLAGVGHARQAEREREPALRSIPARIVDWIRSRENTADAAGSWLDDQPL